MIWWPSDLDIKVKQGEWNISLHLGENGSSHDLSAGPVYTLEIREKSNPSTVVTAEFDLVGMEIRQ